MSWNEHNLPALYMLWPMPLIPSPQSLEVPRGYSLIEFDEGATDRVIELLTADGEKMSHDQWVEYRNKIIPNGLILIRHDESAKLVAAAGAVHNPDPGRYYFPFGGELGYLIVRAEHRRKGLGRVVVSRVVNRFQAAGYSNIRVGVQGFRLPAIVTYLKTGFRPFLHSRETEKRWQNICGLIGWQFEPDLWPRAAR